jgi:hypothetical protein
LRRRQSSCHLLRSTPPASPSSSAPSMAP